MTRKALGDREVGQTTTRQAVVVLGMAVRAVSQRVELGKLAFRKTAGGHRGIPANAASELLRSELPRFPGMAFSSGVIERSSGICAQTYQYSTDWMKSIRSRLQSVARNLFKNPEYLIRVISFEVAIYLNILRMCRFINNIQFYK